MAELDWGSGLLCNACAWLCFNGSFYVFLVLSMVALLGLSYVYFMWKEGAAYTKTNRLDGKVVIITGCNSGIGKETAIDLARRGARVYMACRDYKRTERARTEVMLMSRSRDVFNLTLDLASLKSVREFAQKFLAAESRLDILINNAGIMATPRKITEDGFEEQFQVNYLGHFLLTNLLLERLKACSPSRIVVVSSWAYGIGSIQKDDLNSEKNYNPYRAYAQSKLATHLFVHQLAKQLKGTNVTANCLHPGSVQTELFRHNQLLSLGSTVINWLLRTPQAGAQTSLYVALDPELEGKSGGYYYRLREQKPWAKARDDNTAEWLWRQSTKMVGLDKDQ